MEKIIESLCESIKGLAIASKAHSAAINCHIKKIDELTKRIEKLEKIKGIKKSFKFWG